MSSKISEFLSALNHGGARPNRFECMISFPAFAGGSDEIRSTAFLVNSTQIPGSNLGTIEQPFRGRQIKLAGDRTFDEWTATFVNDIDFGIYDAMTRWQNAINQFNSNIGFQMPSDYMSDVTLWQLDNQDNRVKEIILKYAWPSAVGTIELAQDSNDVLETFDCTMVFSDIENGSST